MSIELRNSASQKMCFSFSFETKRLQSAIGNRNWDAPLLVKRTFLIMGIGLTLTTGSKLLIVVGVPFTLRSTKIQ